jgi:hypothetical protein
MAVCLLKALAHLFQVPDFYCLDPDRTQQAGWHQWISITVERGRTKGSPLSGWHGIVIDIPIHHKSHRMITFQLVSTVACRKPFIPDEPVGPLVGDLELKAV